MSITVETAASVTAMTTIDAVKQALDMESDNSKNALIERLIDAATSALEEYAGRVFALQTYVEQLAGTDHPYLMVTHLPLKSVTQIIVDSEIITDYSIQDDQSGTLYRATGWSRFGYVGWDVERYRIPHTSQLNIYVTYTAGYVMPGEDDRDLPARFEEAAIRTVAAWMRQNLRGGTDVASRKVGDLSITYRDVDASIDASTLGLPPDARALVGQRATL